ncbi:MAG: hypothetical protein KBT15_02315 [Bacteroidales bacterium]|nr:hypothetical protein [Candidatus Minthousia equi]
MMIRKHIYGLAAVTMLMWLSGCAESDPFIDGSTADDSNIIHIGGIQNADVETSLGGITTRATGDDSNTSVDAETVDWLLGPLFGGLDITYGAKGKPDTEAVAILKLLKQDENGGNTKENIKYSEFSTATEKIAEYSFKYLANGEDAKWYDNGEHYFQGVFVPEKLRYDANNETPEDVNGPESTKAPRLKLDQSKDVTTNPDANYTLLERYLGMPADAYIHATIGRIKLPFRHRLARVLAYVLIDPTMGTDVTIDGYNLVDGKDDASTSKIKFCNVKVLAGVEQKESSTSGHVELTPKWDQSRKVIPHFVEESGSKDSKGEVKDAENFIMFYDTEQKAYIFPTNDEDWEDANTRWNTAYTNALGGGTTDEEKRKAAEKADAETNLKRTIYGKVPCYDLIVRPTYKNEEMVMYDEDGADDETKRAELASLKNNIDFEITLSNGLEYEKGFEFDLDANFQTIVYLRINRESIDYNTSGADVWKEDVKEDGYYGVNNQNGNTLSYAGSSWQRAYRIGTKTDNVTDGHWYGKDDPNDDDNIQDDDNMPWYPQYVDQTKWVKMFAEAHEGGLHHGDYFILDQDITIDATLLPDNFIFTGHLDGQDHTITVINAGKAWEEWKNATTADLENTTVVIYTGKDKSETFTMPSPLYTKVHHDAVPYEESELTEVNGVKYVTVSLTHVPAKDAEYYTNVDEYNTAKGTTLTAEQFEALSTEEKIKTPAVADHYEVNASSIPGTTPKVEAYDEFPAANPTRGELLTAPDNTYYTSQDSEAGYKKPQHLYTEKDHTSGTTLFAGLNGYYTAAIGEANVHSEDGKLVPYIDNDTKTGWRAEVINTKIDGADMFPAEAIKADGNYDVNIVSGYIYNCWKGSEKIKNHTPSIPKYK